MAFEEAEIRAALGIDEEADPVAAIANLKAKTVELQTTIASNKGTADAAVVAQLNNDLAAAKRALILEQSENATKIAAIEAEARKDRITAIVEKAIANGKPPRMREQMLEVGMMMEPAKFNDFLATIPTIDMTERGVASGTELADLEPTQADYAAAKAMGIDTNDKAWRMATMSARAQARGLKLPAEVA